MEICRCSEPPSFYDIIFRGLFDTSFCGQIWKPFKRYLIIISNSFWFLNAKLHSINFYISIGFFNKRDHTSYNPVRSFCSRSSGYVTCSLDCNNQLITHAEYQTWFQFILESHFASRDLGWNEMEAAETVSFEMNQFDIYHRFSVSRPVASAMWKCTNPTTSTSHFHPTKLLLNITWSMMIKRETHWPIVLHHCFHSHLSSHCWPMFRSS